MASPIEFYTVQLEDTGIVLRAYFYMCVQHDNGDKEWHYFCVDPAEKPPFPPNDDAPVFEHNYVQFPQAFSDLPEDDANLHIYRIAKLAGMNREGLL